jgi:glutamate-1-semialdehyde 2,1-aminomutase
MSATNVQKARSNFADRNPGSRRHYDEARKYMPGGQTRSVLTHAPFPLTFISGSGATLTDVDGHTYIDFLGDYTAGLLGHSERRVLDHVQHVLTTNASVGGVHPAEATLARLMCERFALERVRFTNSGTEANLLAMTTAVQATGRKKIMVFSGGYHGSVFYFASGNAPWNAPFDFIISPFNDQAAALQHIADNATTLAAVVVEPMLGSSGCLPCSPTFLSTVFEAARNIGAICIADEVMTSRHGASGMMHLLGVEADITAFGKYIGGGFSFGAFGGKAQIMDMFDTSPETGLASPVAHGGTFNNNLSSVSAGCKVLGEVFTAPIAVAHTSRGDEFRHAIQAVIARSGAPVSITGFGSMMSLHACAQSPQHPDHVANRDTALQEQLFFGLLERGIYTATRGMVNLGLAHTDDQLAQFLDALSNTLASLESATS